MTFDLTHEVVSELAAQVLRGEFNHISEDALTERLSDSDAFWKELVLTISAFHADSQKADMRFSRLIGTVRGIAFDLAIDAAPAVIKKLNDQHETEKAIEQAEAML